MNTGGTVFPVAQQFCRSNLTDLFGSAFCINPGSLMDCCDGCLIDVINFIRQKGISSHDLLQFSEIKLNIIYC